MPNLNNSNADCMRCFHNLQCIDIMFSLLEISEFLRGGEEQFALNSGVHARLASGNLALHSRLPLQPLRRFPLAAHERTARKHMTRNWAKRRDKQRFSDFQVREAEQEVFDSLHFQLVKRWTRSNGRAARGKEKAASTSAGNEVRLVAGVAIGWR